VTPRDQIRQFALDNSDDFSPQDLANILAQYPARGDLANILADDRNAFAAALTRIGIDIDAPPEPISQAFLDFDRDVDLATAAGALLVSPDDLADNLGLLAPAMSVLDGGFLDRDDFNVFYRNSLCTLSVVNENTPEPGFCAAQTLP
jgi:hypothetical protein